MDSIDEDEVPVKYKNKGASNNEIDTSLINVHELNHSPNPL